MAIKASKLSFAKIFPLLFAILIEVAGFGVVYPVLTEMFSRPDSALFAPGTSDEMRYFYLGLCFFLYPFLMFFGSSILGDLSDRIGRKKILMISMAGLSLSFILTGIAVSTSNLPLLLIGRGISGFMAASIPVAMAAISDLSKENNKAVHMSYIALADTSGFIIGPLFGGLLSNEKWGSFFQFSTPFFVFAVLALISFLCLAFLFEEVLSERRRKKIEIFGFIKAFADAWNHRPVRMLSIAFFCMQIGFSLYLPLILIYLLEQFDYSSFSMGLFNAYLGVWLAIGLGAVIPRAVKLWKIEWICAGCAGMEALAQLCTSFVSSEWAIWILAIPLALFGQVAYSAMFTSYSNAVDEKSQGWALGISGSVMAISWALASLAPGLISYITPMKMVFGGSILLLSCFGILIFYCRTYSRLRLSR